MTEAGYAPPPDWPSAGDEIGAQNFGPFGHDALVRYAAVSGDDNPLHLDPDCGKGGGSRRAARAWDADAGLFRAFDHGMASGSFHRPAFGEVSAAGAGGRGHSRFGPGPAQPWGAEARTHVCG